MQGHQFLCCPVLEQPGVASHGQYWSLHPDWPQSTWSQWGHQGWQGDTWPCQWAQPQQCDCTTWQHPDHVKQNIWGHQRVVGLNSHFIPRSLGFCCTNEGERFGFFSFDPKLQNILQAVQYIHPGRASLLNTTQILTSYILVTSLSNATSAAAGLEWLDLAGAILVLLTIIATLFEEKIIDTKRWRWF